MRFNLLACLSLSTSVVLGFAQDSGSSDVNALLQSLATLPDCAQTCIAAALPEAADCALGDLACLCASEPFTASSGACVLANCTVRGALQTQQWQTKACDVPTPNNSGMTRRVCWTLFGLSTLAIALRFLARTTFLEGNLGWDDWTILFGYCFLIPSTSIVHVMTNLGLGQDLWMVPFDNITSVFYYFYIEEFMYCVFVMATKISIVLLYLRIIPGTIYPRFRALCWTVIGLMIAYTVAFVVALAVQCTPVSFTWTQWDGEHQGKCVNLEAQVYAGAIGNIFWDLVVFIMPIPRLLKLQVRDTRKKVMVILTFLVGLFGTICSIIRLRYLTQWGKSSNATQHYNEIGIWSVVEGDVGIICACMPAIAGPILHFLKKVVGSTLSKNKSKISASGGLGGKTKESKGVIRVSSSAGGSERGEVDHVALKHGGISKTVEASMYNLPYETNSDDDVELMARSHGHGQGLGGESVGGYQHEYAGSWR